jgi:hypothetical protein
MRKVFVFVIVVFLLVNSVRAEDWQYTAEKMEATIDISSGVEIIPEDSSWEVKDLTLEFGLWPRTTQYQEVLYMGTEPESEIKDNKLVFELEDVEETDVDVIINGIVEVSENRPEIDEKVDFPIKDNDYEEYTESTENINADNEDVIELSSTIVEGEDDLFKSVYLIGEWVNQNIEYKLDEETEFEVKNSDWVFENRYGACDEITNMFMAMIRSLGIPARYIGGYAFTDIDNIERFESHAWSEVYFPNYGWVPYDITYGQFGFVDISHITLSERLCSSENAVQIEMKGIDVDILGKGIEIDANVNELKGSVDSNVVIDSEFFKEEVDFGSYNIVKATIENKRPYYIVSPILISNNVKAELLDENIKYLVLGPDEERTVYWKIKITDDLNRGYYYSLPFNVYSLDGETNEISLRVEEGKQYLDEDDVDSVIDEIREERTKSYSADVKVDCSMPDYAYTYEKINTECNISNTGNKFIENLEVCGDSCEIIDIGIGKKQNIGLFMDVKKGMKISLSNEDISKVYYPETEILDYPEIKIVNLSYPSTVNYEDDFY